MAVIVQEAHFLIIEPLPLHYHAMSLFGSDEESDSLTIEGLYHLKGLIPQDLLDEQLSIISASDLVSLNNNQSMLWGEQAEKLAAPILRVLPELLRPHLSTEVYDMFFESNLALQVIVNLYAPGQGISPHVDLPHRYADGILGVSFLSSAVMEFTFIRSEESNHAILLAPGDVYVLSGEARYEYKHSIPERMTDVWEIDGKKRTLIRGNRISITLRRMLEGADIVGE